MERTGFYIHFSLSLISFFIHKSNGINLKMSWQNEEATKLGNCSLFQGSWVYDDSYPLYDSLSCPFLLNGFNCLKNGRLDKSYLKYRWQPTACNIPRFDGRVLLEKMKGKKVMFVGDSLGNNQFESLACLLHAALPAAKYVYEPGDTLITLKFPEYGASMQYLKNEFLVDYSFEKVGRILKLDSINSSSYWKGADVLIFNSYHWWTHTGKLQAWDYLEVGGKLIKDMDRMKAYKIGLATWANWIDSNIDSTKTRVFFQGIPAVHFVGADWGEPKEKTCKGQTKPLGGATYPGERYPGEPIIKEVLRIMKKHVHLLDITLLTQLRKDGHPSFYAERGTLDCSHWCVGGVPDSWNLLLYYFIIVLF